MFSKLTAVQREGLADLHRAILGGDLLVGNVVAALLLQLVCHAGQEVCGEVVHAHVAPCIPQLPCACRVGTHLGEGLT